VVDTRRIARRREWVANELQTEIHGLCDSAQTAAALHKQVAVRHSAELSPAKIDQAIGDLCDAKILLSMNGKLLALGIA
jgi:hypothetical protein